MLRIDVGCGGKGTRYPGFIGIDTWPVDGVHEDRGKDTYLRRDVVKQGLPFADGEADLIICLHVLEHLTRDDAIIMLREIYRVLKPGKVGYVCTPDLHLMAEKYLAQDYEFYERKYEMTGIQVWNGPTLTDRFLDSIVGMGPHGHKYGYDLASLLTVCQEAGFMVTAELPDDCPFHTRTDHEVMIQVAKPEV